MIEVLQPGPATTIQGTRAWRMAHLGIPLGGPADSRSHANANRLVGNPDDAGAIEMTLLGATLRLEAPGVVALCGAPFDATMPFDQAVRLNAGDTVSIRGTPRGARCYLAVAGGIALASGTRVTKGQMLPIGEPKLLSAPPLLPPWPWLSPVVLRYTAPEPQPDLTYEVTNDANRRGIRLAGPALSFNREIITEGVNAGTIQVPPSGQPVIIFYDQTTTGGYPKLGTIIRADLARVGQLRPRDQVVLRRISWEEASEYAHEASD
jgi:5-oxoprolinase (ATP-hydrolysing) subunit C